MADADVTPEVRLAVTVDAPAALAFEPTGMQYDLLPGDRVTVTITGAPDGVVEIHHSPDTLQVWEPPGGTLRAWDAAGDELVI